MEIIKLIEPFKVMYSEP